MCVEHLHCPCMRVVSMASSASSGADAGFDLAVEYTEASARCLAPCSHVCRAVLPARPCLYPPPCPLHPRRLRWPLRSLWATTSICARTAAASATRSARCSCAACRPTCACPCSASCLTCRWARCRGWLAADVAVVELCVMWLAADQPETVMLSCIPESHSCAAAVLPRVACAVRSGLRDTSLASHRLLCCRAQTNLARWHAAHVP